MQRTASPNPTRLVVMYADGGLILNPRNHRKCIGVYWSVRAEERCAQPPAPVVLRRHNRENTTNNDAEWLAVKEALTLAVERYAGLPILLFSDSQLIVNQFNEVWRSKIARHHRWRTECRALADQIEFLVVEWRPRRVMVRKLGH